MADNYNALYEKSREKFLTYDQKPMIRYFRLGHDEGFLYFKLLGRDAKIDRKTGVITVEGEKAAFDEACTVYDILSRAEKAPVLSGRWVTVTEFGGIIAIRHQESLHPELQAMAGKCAQLREICLSWGGKEMERGDVSFVVPLLDFFPVWLQFWDADEEFPAKLTCLWDANTLDYMYYETTWYALNYLRRELLRRLREMEK